MCPHCGGTLENHEIMEAFLTCIDCGQVVHVDDAMDDDFQD